MKTLDISDITRQIEQMQHQLTQQQQELAPLIVKAQAARDEAEAPVRDLRAQIKDALVADDDAAADELIDRLTHARRKAQQISYRWTGQELGLRNEIAFTETDLRDAREALSLAQQLGGQPETYEEVFQAFDIALSTGQGLIVDIDDAGRTELRHDELAEFKDEIQMGEGIRVLALTR